MKHERNFLVLTVLITLSGFGLVACGSSAGDGPPTETITHTLEISETATETSQPSGTTIVMESQPAPTDEQPVANPRDFSDLVEVDAQEFWGHDTGSIPGFRFQSPSGNINCHLSEIPAACNVQEHAPWPAGDRRADGLPGDIPPSAVGWMGEMDLLGPPMNWLQQGTFPAVGVGKVLEYGQMVTVLRKIDGMPTAIACGSRESGMTCLIENGRHGFTVSRENYESW